MKWIILIILVVILLLFLSARYFYNIAINRHGKNFFTLNTEEKDSEDALKKAKGWFLPLYSSNEWTLNSFDNLKLKASYIKHDTSSKGVVLITHGYLGKSKDMATFAKLFYDLGYSLLIPDASGHGRNDGDYYGFGWHERNDQIRWINEIIAHCGNDTNIILYGISMGAATVMNTSGEKLPHNVKLVIEDCGYTSVWDEMTYQMKTLFKLPPFPIAHATGLYTRYKAGFSFKEASPLNQIKKNKLPVLMIHGDADTFVPFSMFETLYEAANEPKEKYIVSGAKHGGSYNVDPTTYRLVVSSFIEKYVN